MDGWNTTLLLGRPIFRGYVSFREGIYDIYYLWFGRISSINSIMLPTLSESTTRPGPFPFQVGQRTINTEPGTCDLDLYNQTTPQKKQNC